MEIKNRPARILILGEARSIHTRRWVGYFRERGWVVRWLSFPPIPAGAGAEEIPDHGLRKALAVLASVGRVKRAIRSFAPDIISALFLPDYGWLAGLCGVHPLAVSAWGSDVLISPLRSPWHRRRIEYVLRKADVLFADAELLGVRMRDLGASESKLHIIPLGVEASWLNGGAARSAQTEGPLRIISNRHLEPLYRVETLIRAASILATGIPNQYEFVIVGGGSLRPELARLVAELGLESSVRFLGAISEEQMRHQLRQAELFVSCSSSDGTSVSMLEAMASGCVPIVTDLDVNHEWIQPGENGLIFPVDDAAALASAISFAAGDAHWRGEVRARNRAIIASRALWSDNMAAVEAVMAQAISTGPKRGAAGKSV